MKRNPSAAPLSSNEEATLASVTSLNSRVAALTFGMLGALGLWLATAVLLVEAGQTPGAHLSLLSIFLPGYRVSWGGSFVALIWGFVFGAVAGALLYRGYARTIHKRLEYLTPGVDRRRRFRTPILRISGAGLGVTLGILAALQLLLMTNWLVLRGTAAESANAALLSQVLPGYRVSVIGSVVGATELFALVFLGALAFGTLYNRLVDSRQARNRPGA